MEDLYYFETIEQIQATAEPTRWQILSLLIGQPMTGSQLARVLGIPRPLAHYHLKILEKVGLVEFQEERMRGGVVEKYYRAIARQYRSDHLVDSGRTETPQNGTNLQTGEVIRNMMLAMIEVAHADLAQTDIRSVLAKSGFDFQDDIYLTLEQTKMLISDLRTLGERYQKVSAENPHPEPGGNQKELSHLRYTFLITPVPPLPESGTPKTEIKKKRERIKGSLYEPY